MHLTRHPKPDSTYRITTARKSVPDDQAIRVRGYVISMSIRIVFFVLAALTYIGFGWKLVGWGFIAAALVIPYFAVVYANGGREPNEDPPDTLGSFSKDLERGHELPPGTDSPR